MLTPASASVVVVVLLLLSEEVVASDVVEVTGLALGPDVRNVSQNEAKRFFSIDS